MDLALADGIFVQVLKWIYGQSCDIEAGSIVELQDAVKLLQVATLERALAAYGDTEARRTHGPENPRHATPSKNRSEEEGVMTPDQDSTEGSGRMSSILRSCAESSPTRDTASRSLSIGSPGRMTAMIAGRRLGFRGGSCPT